MGILDAPASPPKTSARLAGWHRKLREATVDSTVLVVGDSTGAGTTRWVRLLCDKIAAAYPTWTVLYKPFDDPTKTYPSGSFVTVQTGTNGRTLTVWNGSVSGQVIGYAMNTSQMYTGITPDLVIFNYGHNSPQLTDDYRALTAQAVQGYQKLFPKAGIVITAQNPRAPADAVYADVQGRQQANFEYAVSNGFPLVDVNEDFRQYGNYGADLLLGDGIHPNDSVGSPRWANLVWQVIRYRGVPDLPGQQPTVNRLWIPATSFWAISGSPTSGVANGHFYWALSHGVDQAIAVSIDLPAGWSRQNIYPVFTPGASAAGSVVMAGGHMYLGPTAYVPGGSTAIGTWSEGSGSATTALVTGHFGKTLAPTLWSRIALGGSPVNLKVTRTGTSGSDTLSADAQILGLLVEKAF